jgi:hypothetical protein
MEMMVLMMFNQKNNMNSLLLIHRNGGSVLNHQRASKKVLERVFTNIDV